MHRTTLFILTAAALALTALTLRPTTPLHVVPPPTTRAHPPPAHLGAPLAPQGGTTSSTLTTTTALSHSQLAPGGLTYAEVHVRAAADAPTAQAPVSVALVIDVSGSMQGEKLHVAKLAARRLVEQLAAGDTLALVPFSDAGWLLGEVVTINDRTRRGALERIDQLTADGSTNLSGGLELAERALAFAHGSRRVVVISDGQPTVGETTPAGLSALTARLHRTGLAVTFLGVGDGFNANLLLALSEVGGGLYGSLVDVYRLPQVLEQELAQARQAVARSVVLTLSGVGDATVEHVVGFPSRVIGGQVAVDLADLARGADVTVFAAVRLAPGATGSAAVSARASWVSPATEQALVSDPSTAQVVVIADAAEAERTRDEVHFARALKASGGEQLLQASAALERGDSATALGIFDDVRALFGASADALAGESAVVAKEADAVRADPSAVQARGKSLQRKTLESFSERNVY